jgi:hypothetical protein
LFIDFQRRLALAFATLLCLRPMAWLLHTPTEPLREWLERYGPVPSTAAARQDEDTEHGLLAREQRWRGGRRQWLIESNPARHGFPPPERWD